MVRASRISTHPLGVCQVVTSTVVPGSYARWVGTLIPYGPNRKYPAPRSKRLPKLLGLSNRGTHSQSTDPSGATSAPVWQFDRNAYSAIGGNGELGRSDTIAFLHIRGRRHAVTHSPHTSGVALAQVRS